MSDEAKVLLYTIESAIGVLIALLFIIDKVSIMRVSKKRDLTFSYFVSRAQVGAGVCFLIIEGLATTLGYLVATESPLIGNHYIDILLVHNTLLLVALFVLWVGGYLVLGKEDEYRETESSGLD